MQTNCVALSIKLLPFLVVQVELLTQFAWLDGQRNWNTNWECVVETVVQRWQPLDLVIFYSLRSGAASHDIGACNSSMARLLERLSERAMIDGTDNCGNIRTTKRGGGKQAGKAQRSKSIYVEWEGGGRKNKNMPPYSCSQSAPTPPHIPLSTALILLYHLCRSHRHASILVSNKSMRCMQQFWRCQLRKQKMAHLHDSSIREIFDNESTNVCVSVCVRVRGCVIKYRTQHANINLAHRSITIIEGLIYYWVFEIKSN